MSPYPIGLIGSSYTFGDPAIANLGQSSATVYATDPLAYIQQVLNNPPEPMPTYENSPVFLSATTPFPSMYNYSADTNYSSGTHTNPAGAAGLIPASNNPKSSPWYEAWTPQNLAGDLVQGVIAQVPNTVLVILGVFLILLAVWALLGRSPVQDTINVTKAVGRKAAEAAAA